MKAPKLQNSSTVRVEAQPGYTHGLPPFIPGTKRKLLSRGGTALWQKSRAELAGPFRASRDFEGLIRQASIKRQGLERARRQRSMPAVFASLVLFACMLWSSSGPAFAQAVEHIIGHARVIDGDTIDIGSVRIRLWGIDAPESKQPCQAVKSRAIVTP